ncbi:MAG: 50S ribosomal protein L13 [Candidatus Liptonbacteria bacterium GWC1_60_9]|uniref:Large ribosomal subunit protein uL13 n=3 Tax=Candidatus Liptoniibacteriota TaxID=1817909 RepID=A0A1G2CNP4_9BACT|nr:MAG: 50S ribosomal protein L13 [Parcubacteria group bacterium GW2011_GWA1_60_11]OGY97053.1 MAG: 50S ribosomal protein L13 [Candidatus Liptonbacteria bacterium GWC1_60_9]OGY98346.1 MAG: 50S ribosomal protein L13 [Candidatus Liptonbacteria bacterium RIFCSPHIGHO2_12_FULL_60_13]OGZ02832.1 MAG: 50S ribosomal protein L13 [Candidatus Liptonbacteria bacterium RIFCSPLOWO2_12_FULL_60_15]
MEEHVIDAKGQRLGRLATKIARLLQGKHRTDYNPRVDRTVKVRVVNVRALEITGRKAEQKVYFHHTGYMGHLKELTYRQKQEKNPAFALRHAVRGMLPKNWLRDKRLKRLVIGN